MVKEAFGKRNAYRKPLGPEILSSTAMAAQD